MVQADSRQPLTAKVRVRSQANRGQFRGCQSDSGTGFSLSTSVFPCQYHCTNAPHSSSCTCCSNQTDKGQKPGSLPKTNALLEIGEHWIEKCFHFAIFKGIRAVKYSKEDMFINCTHRTHCKVCQKSEISQQFGTRNACCKPCSDDVIAINTPTASMTRRDAGRSGYFTHQKRIFSVQHRCRLPATEKENLSLLNLIVNMKVTVYSQYSRRQVIQTFC
jgi:hypothetical protein